MGKGGREEIETQPEPSWGRRKRGNSQISLDPAQEEKEEGKTNYETGSGDTVRRRRRRRQMSIRPDDTAMQWHFHRESPHAHRIGLAVAVSGAKSGLHFYPLGKYNAPNLRSGRAIWAASSCILENKKKINVPRSTACTRVMRRNWIGERRFRMRAVKAGSETSSRVESGVGYESRVHQCKIDCHVDKNKISHSTYFWKKGREKDKFPFLSFLSVLLLTSSHSHQISKRKGFCMHDFIRIYLGFLLGIHVRNDANALCGKLSDRHQSVELDSKPFSATRHQ